MWPPIQVWKSLSKSEARMTCYTQPQKIKLIRPLCGHLSEYRLAQHDIRNLAFWSKSHTIELNTRAITNHNISDLVKQIISQIRVHVTSHSNHILQLTLIHIHRIHVTKTLYLPILVANLPPVFLRIINNFVFFTLYKENENISLSAYFYDPMPSWSQN
jgi:hypothetical protein